MDDYIVDNFYRKEDDFVVKVQVPPLGTGTPARLVVFDKYFFEWKFVEGVEVV